MRLHRLSAVVVVALVGTSPTPAQVTTYQFNNSYAADESGKPALNPVSPGQLSFITDTVTVGSQSVTRTVLARGGTVGTAPLAGVELNTGGLLTNPNVYSIEMVFSMSTQAGYERLLNTDDASDNGLYVQGSNVTLYDNAPNSGTQPFTYGPSTYHHMVLTYDGTTAREYLDRSPDITLATAVVSNPNNLVRFFLDNSTDGATDEYGPGNVALVRVWDQVLTPAQVSTLAANPFPVPEPRSLALAGAAAAGLGGAVVRRRRTPPPT